MICDEYNENNNSTFKQVNDMSYLKINVQGNFANKNVTSTEWEPQNLTC